MNVRDGTGWRLPAHRIAPAHAALFAALLLLSGCHSGEPRPPNRPRPRAKAPAVIVPMLQASAQPDPSKYVGSAACVSCHKTEADEWLVSRHRQTLQIPNAAKPARVSPPTGRIPGTDIDVIVDAATKQFRVRPVGDSKESYPLTLALGSGKTGITYVEVIGDRALEFYKSYFVPDHRWYTTPGLEAIPAHAFFSGHTAAASRQCILCHSSAPGGHSLVPDNRFFGVGCESCHGPGKAHAEAERRGLPDPSKMDSLSTLSATQINELCGRCHRTAQDLNLSGPDSVFTNRLQPYGLMMSRCFLEGGRSLSCITCHDPHGNASTDIKTYERVCLSCHSGAPAASAPHTTPGKVCPVNASSGCISCHMPRRTALTNPDLPILMPDHWIRVYKRHSP